MKKTIEISRQGLQEKEKNIWAKGFFIDIVDKSRLFTQGIPSSMLHDNLFMITVERDLRRKFIYDLHTKWCNGLGKQMTKCHFGFLSVFNVSMFCFMSIFWNAFTTLGSPFLFCVKTESKCSLTVVKLKRLSCCRMSMRHPMMRLLMMTRCSFWQHLHLLTMISSNCWQEASYFWEEEWHQEWLSLLWWLGTSCQSEEQESWSPI